jgi:hypothetical protein
VVNYLVQRFREPIEDEGVEDEVNSQVDEIVEDFEGLQDDDGYFLWNVRSSLPQKTHSCLVVTLARGGSMVDV